MDMLIALIALAVALLSLLVTIYFARRSLRPVVSATVKTHEAKNEAIAYDLVLRNSGMIPARNVRLTLLKEIPDSAFGSGVTADDKKRWEAAFKEENTISMLHNGSQMACSFGYSKKDDKGFWKYRATIPVKVSYESWFTGVWESLLGGPYSEQQNLQILDSLSFTGYSWAGKPEWAD